MSPAAADPWSQARGAARARVRLSSSGLVTRPARPSASPRPAPQVEDLSGNALYERLGVTRRASPAAVRAAFRAAARVHHPDKGGDPKRFAQLRHAFEARPARTAGPWAVQ